MRRLFLLLLLPLLAACARERGGERWGDPSGRFFVTVPTGWSHEEVGDGLLLIHPGPGAEGLTPEGEIYIGYAEGAEGDSALVSAELDFLRGSLSGLSLIEFSDAANDAPPSAVYSFMEGGEVRYGRLAALPGKGSSSILARSSAREEDFAALDEALSRILSGIEVVGGATGVRGMGLTPGECNAKICAENPRHCPCLRYGDCGMDSCRPRVGSYTFSPPAAGVRGEAPRLISPPDRG